MRTASRLHLLLLAAGLLLAGPGLLLAQQGQTNLNEAAGFTPDHVLVGGDAGEFIEPGTGVVNLSIPIGPAFQVGPSLSYDLRLNYTTAFWNHDVVFDPPTPLLVYDRSGLASSSTWAGSCWWRETTPCTSTSPRMARGI
jgi:hypothetical protein